MWDFTFAFAWAAGTRGICSNQPDVSLDVAMLLRSTLAVGLLSTAALAPLPFARPAAAEVVTRPILPAEAAFRAAEVAVDTCRQQGYNVTATVVNSEGALVAVLRGDGATPHTVENSFNKAYTAISLGPIQKVDSTAKIYDAMKMNPGFGTWPLPPNPIRGFTFNPGGLVLYSGGELVGGIGISGAPKGTIDEGCALKGRDAALPFLR